MAVRNPAALVPGGEGGQEKGLEEVESYLLVALDEVGAAGRRVAGEEQGRLRQFLAAAAALR